MSARQPWQVFFARRHCDSACHGTRHHLFPYAVDKRQPQGLCSRHFHCGSSIFPLNVRHVVRPAISVCNYSQSTVMQGTQRPKPNGFLLLQLFDCLQHLVGLTLEHANLLFCFLIMCKNDNNKFRLPNSFSSL